MKSSPQYVELFPKIGGDLKRSVHIKKINGKKFLLKKVMPKIMFTQNLNCENVNDKKDDGDGIAGHLGSVQPCLLLFS